jgi:hypothetical protein
MTGSQRSTWPASARSTPWSTRRVKWGRGPPSPSSWQGFRGNIRKRNTRVCGFPD